jgi:hypothetical protein
MSLSQAEPHFGSSLVAEAPSEGVVRGAPKALLRIEGAAVLAAAVGLYAWRGDGWMLFSILFLAPDVAMLGYLAGRGWGAAVYNAGHSYVLPLALAFAGEALSAPLPLALGLIWIAHIGFDRMLGYGLKYPDGFGHSHLGAVGARPRRRTDAALARRETGPQSVS